jgi:hypothetical protein
MIIVVLRKAHFFRQKLTKNEENSYRIQGDPDRANFGQLDHYLSGGILKTDLSHIIQKY